MKLVSRRSFALILISAVVQSKLKGGAGPPDPSGYSNDENFSKSAWAAITSNSASKVPILSSTGKDSSAWCSICPLYVFNGRAGIRLIDSTLHLGLYIECRRTELVKRDDQEEQEIGKLQCGTRQRPGTSRRLSTKYSGARPD